MTHGHKTRYPSLVLGNEGGLGGEGRSNTLSYNQFGRGIPSSNNLRGLYDGMFNSDPQLQKGQRSRLASDKRRLDRVLESYREMKRKLGRDDSQKLERYMQALREVEREIERMERWTGNDVSPGCTSSAREPAFGRAGTRTGRRVRKGRG